MEKALSDKQEETLKPHSTNNMGELHYGTPPLTATNTSQSATENGHKSQAR